MSGGLQMKRLAPFILVALLASCFAPPHRFEIRSDEPMKGVEIDLANARKIESRLISPHLATAEVFVADSGGEIRVTLLGGRRIVCPVGYITNGEPEPHNILIRDGRCHGV